MQIDVHTLRIDPLRQTFDHLKRRFGDKPASRYQEGSYDIQASENLHYRPMWDPEQSLYDANLSKIKMQDWYVLKDPRQFYYSTYTLTRARQQDTLESNFKSFESLGLINNISEELREKLLKMLVPLRHAAWGANLNNTFMCGYGYSVIFTQPCMYQAMDNLGIAQYLSRIGLILDDVDGLVAAKNDWLEGDAWQALRHYCEDTLVIRDPLELFVAQNVAMDGLLYPIIYESIINDRLSVQGASGIAILTQFMTNWHIETKKWIDAVVKTIASESAENKAILEEWVRMWSERALEVLEPIVHLALNKEDTHSVMAFNHDAFRARMNKAGLSI